MDELRSVCWEAACQSAQAYDLARRVAFGAFIYQHAMSAALTHCRQEWAYCFHDGTTVGDFDTLSSNHELLVFRVSEAPVYACLNEALTSLEPLQRTLMQEIYWVGCSQAELAKTGGISQPCVGKRKQAALEALLAVLKSQCAQCGGCKCALTPAGMQAVPG
jgi:DNA-directed RNA polymerase specialized sigma24 family protein